MQRVSARGEGQGTAVGQPAQQVWEYLLVWVDWASKYVLEKYVEYLWRLSVSGGE